MANSCCSAFLLIWSLSEARITMTNARGGVIEKV